MLCRSCEHEVDPIFELTPRLQHHGKLSCPLCGRFMAWKSKPENEGQRTRTSRFTLEHFAHDKCQLCRRTKEMLGNNETFHLHHLDPLSEGGPDTKENIIVVCSACHSKIHWLHTYLHDHFAFPDDSDGTK